MPDGVVSSKKGIMNIGDSHEQMFHQETVQSIPSLDCIESHHKEMRAIGLP